MWRRRCSVLMCHTNRRYIFKNLKMLNVMLYDFFVLVVLWFFWHNLWGGYLASGRDGIYRSSLVLIVTSPVAPRSRGQSTFTVYINWWCCLWSRDKRSTWSPIVWSRFQCQFQHKRFRHFPTPAVMYDAFPISLITLSIQIPLLSPVSRRRSRFDWLKMFMYNLRRFSIASKDIRGNKRAGILSFFHSYLYPEQRGRYYEDEWMEEEWSTR